MLLHLVDVQPEDQSDPIENALAIEQELAEYSQALIERPIWLALSKVDQLDDADLQDLMAEMAETFPDRPVYGISALGDVGLDELKNDLMQYLIDERMQAAEDPDFAEHLQSLEKRISDDVFTHSERMRQRRQSEAGADQNEIDEDFDDTLDGPETEVIYVEISGSQQTQGPVTRSALTEAKRIVVKVGSSLLTSLETGLEHAKIQGYCADIAKLTKAGKEVILVSSGSIAEGCMRLGWSSRPQEVHRLQAAAAVGQIGLMQAYEQALKALIAAQP